MGVELNNERIKVRGADYRESRRHRAKKPGLPGTVEVRVCCGLGFRRQFRVRHILDRHPQAEKESVDSSQTVDLPEKREPKKRRS